MLSLLSATGFIRICLAFLLPLHSVPEVLAYFPAFVHHVSHPLPQYIYMHIYVVLCDGLRAFGEIV